MLYSQRQPQKRENLYLGRGDEREGELFLGSQWRELTAFFNASVISADAPMGLWLGLQPFQLHTKKDNPGHKIVEQDLVLEITWRSDVPIPSVNGNPMYPKGSDLFKCNLWGSFGNRSQVSWILACSSSGKSWENPGEGTATGHMMRQ